jgi:hypothetical protein
MDRRESQTAIVRPSLKRKLEPESQDQNQARKILVVEDPNKDGTLFSLQICVLLVCCWIVLKYFLMGLLLLFFA